MEKVGKEELTHTKLYNIIQPILSRLDILQPQKLTMNFKQATEKLVSLRNDYENNELNNFVFFLQHLFLDEKNKFDFNLFPIYQIIQANYIRDIFASLMNNINKLNFLEFLNEIGEIFTKLFFDDSNFAILTKKFEHKGLTNYEIILKLLCLGKKNKEQKLLFANYDEFYSLQYNILITNNLLFAININCKLSTSGLNYKHILNTFINDLFFKQMQNEKDQLLEIENFIKNCINIFWCNSIFYMKEEYESFFTILYDYLTEKSTKKFINVLAYKNKKDDFSMKYLEYISNELMILFEDFDNNSLLLFEKSLYDFIIDYKDIYETDNCIDLILKIQSNNNNLSQEEIGLISMVCLNKQFILDINKEINNKKNVNEIIEDLALNEYEIEVLKQLFADANNKMKKDNQGIILNVNGKINTNNSQIEDSLKMEKCIYKADISTEDNKINEINNNDNISIKENIQANII